MREIPLLFAGQARGIRLCDGGLAPANCPGAAAGGIPRPGAFPVGRLDRDTTGLLLLTNDGDYAHKVISPRSKVEKCYLAETEAPVTSEDAAAFAEGLILADGTRCLPAELEPLDGNYCLVRVMEGKYHQVKRMLASRGKPVTRLRRLSIGALSLPPASEPGELRELDESAKNLALTQL